MTAELMRWFPTLILKKSLPEFDQHLDYLADKAYDLRRQLPGTKTGWNCDTYNTLDNYKLEEDRDQIVHDLAQHCIMECYEFSREFGVNKPIEKFRCVDFWFNIAGAGAYQEFHQHANSHFSLVYYVRTPKDCGNIIFQNPTTPTDMYNLPIEKFNVNSFRSCNYTPEQGSILLFRSNLAHMVEKNLSGEDRISIAMNFRIDYDY